MINSTRTHVFIDKGLACSLIWVATLQQNTIQGIDMYNSGVPVLHLDISFSVFVFITLCFWEKSAF